MCLKLEVNIGNWRSTATLRLLKLLIQQQNYSRHVNNKQVVSMETASRTV